MQIFINGQSHELDGPTTVAELLETLQVSVRQVAVEVNLDLVPRGQHATRLLTPGDRVEVVTLVGGG